MAAQADEAWYEAAKELDEELSGLLKELGIQAKMMNVTSGYQGTFRLHVDELHVPFESRDTVLVKIRRVREVLKDI